MMEEFSLADLNGIAEFILVNSRRATLERIAALAAAISNWRDDNGRF